MAGNESKFVGWRKRTDVAGSQWEKVNSTEDDTFAKCYERLQTLCFLTGSEPCQWATLILRVGEEPTAVTGGKQTYRHRALRPGW